MHNRIKMIRKALNLNQTEFGEKIGVKQGSVASYESGARFPLDTVINSICREFDVSEEWLRTGEGEMFIQLSREEELADFFGDVLRGEPDFRRKFVAVLARMTDEEWALLEKKALELMEELKKD